MEEVLFRLHESGFGISDENENVGIQAMLVDPKVQIRRHVDARGIHEHHVILTMVERKYDVMIID